MTWSRRVEHERRRVRRDGLGSAVVGERDADERRPRRRARRLRRPHRCASTASVGVGCHPDGAHYGGSVLARRVIGALESPCGCCGAAAAGAGRSWCCCTTGWEVVRRRRSTCRWRRSSASSTSSPRRTASIDLDTAVDAPDDDAPNAPTLRRRSSCPSTMALPTGPTSCSRPSSSGVCRRRSTSPPTSSTAVRRSPTAAGRSAGPAWRTWRRRGFATIGSHTHTHRVLAGASATDAADEIARSVGLIEERLGRPCQHFAYPKAIAPSPAAEVVVRRQFRTAALAGNVINRAGATDLHRLGRHAVTVADDDDVVPPQGGRRDAPRGLAARASGRLAGATPLRLTRGRRRRGRAGRWCRPGRRSALSRSGGRGRAGTAPRPRRS